MGKILVTAKVNPDLDGSSCTLAYSNLLGKMGQDAEGSIFGSPQFEVEYFIEKHDVQIPQRQDESSDDWDLFVLVDASSMKGLPKVIQVEKVIEVIDHRISEPEKEFTNAKIQNEIIGAAATLIVERFIKVGKKIEKDHAKLLYGAIYHNTLNFIATNTTERDKSAALYLERNYDLSKGIIQEMFNFATQKILASVQTALESDAKEFGPGWQVGSYQLVVWGSEIFSQRDNIVKSLNELRIRMGQDWAFVNVIDLKSRKSHIFSDPKGEYILSKALGAKFKNGWAKLPAILRKQIMPKIDELIVHR